MSRRATLDPDLAIENPDAYRAHVRRMDAFELARHLRSLSRPQMRNHVRAVLPKMALAWRAGVDVDVEYLGRAFEASLRFTPSSLLMLFRGSSAGGRFVYRDDYPPTVHGAVLQTVRELAREARMARVKFNVRFQSDPFTVERLESFVEVSGQLVASDVALRRFVLQHHPEQYERGVAEPARVVLFAHFETEHEEPVRVELASTSHPGYEDRLVGWVEARAADGAVPFERQGSLRDRADFGRDR